VHHVLLAQLANLHRVGLGRSAAEPATAERAADCVCTARGWFRALSRRGLGGCLTSGFGYLGRVRGLSGLRLSRRLIGCRRPSRGATRTEATPGSAPSRGYAVPAAGVIAHRADQDVASLFRQLQCPAA